MRRNDRKVVCVLRYICGVGALVAASCGMYRIGNEMKKKKEKWMSFAEFRQWWEDACENTPNHIVTSAGCNFGFVLNKPTVSSFVFFRDENLRMPYGISCRVSVNIDAMTEEYAFLTKAGFDDFKKQFDEQVTPIAYTSFNKVFTSIYCSAVQKDKGKLNEAEKEKMHNDICNFQMNMYADLQYISHEFDKLYERHSEVNNPA